MNPQQPQNQNPTPNISNPLAAMRPGEQVIFEVRRHPFGLITMYLSFGFLLLLVAVVAAIAPNILTDYNHTTVLSIGVSVFIVAAVMALIFTAIATKVYKGNRWILTDDSLTQVTQVSLFNKQSSQLSLGNLEDITAQQDGIIPHMFGFGLLKVETAGERSKFSFQYCPNPNEYAQKILMARENFEQGRAAGSNESPTPVGGSVNINTQ